MLNIFKALFDSNEKQLNKARVFVDQVNDFEKVYKRKTFEEMRIRVQKFKDELKPIIHKLPKEAKSSIKIHDFKKGLPLYEQNIISRLVEFETELYAILREITNRKYDRRHFDVQILTAVILAQGNKLVEFKTGEGKTQVIHLPTALYALTGRGTHVITVNDYLAKRDGEYAGHILSEIGLSVGIVVPKGSYKFIKDDEIKELKGDDVYDERMSFQIKNPGDVQGWNLVECDKKEAYNCDVIYGVNNEFGFDYLRDNMVSDINNRVQRELYYCIVDEVDSILIDEARTPLIISAPAEESNELYMKFAQVVPRLEVIKDYTVDEKAHSAVLTEEGTEKVEKMLGVRNLWEDYHLAYHLENALRAYSLYKRDDEYIVKEGKVLIVDQFTGRILPGRRYSEGLHQAIEAKENVEIQRESKTLATISFQNFFRLYKILAGGSGTVITEAEEFFRIYNLDSLLVPTHRPIIRKDLTDRVYKNQNAKFNAVVEEIALRHKKGQPLLVGTTSIENSERVSKLLEKKGVEHEILNAKHHEKEARIIAKAGQKDAVTIATNMAGRGTDIVLGEGVKELGGLHVIGTERHDARRIDNQLRGRSGRLGDPGSSRFYVALDDEIMRIQGGQIIQALMERTNIPDDMPIESRLVSNAIENAQKRMEGYHFDIRNNLVKYDDVMNQQREIFYTRRKNCLEKIDIAAKNITKDMDLVQVEKTKKARLLVKNRIIDDIEYEINAVAQNHLVDEEAGNLKEVINSFLDFADDKIIITAILLLYQKTKDERLKLKIQEGFDLKVFLINMIENMKKEEIVKVLEDICIEMINMKEKELGETEFLRISTIVMLQAMDELWSDHLDAIQDLREGIGLRGLAQKDPLIEYKNEAFGYFEEFIININSKYIRRIFKVHKVEQQRSPFNIRTNVDQIQDIITGNREMSEAVQKYLKSKSRNDNVKESKSKSKPKTIIKGRKIGRNEPCPCGSGKKYKKCCYPKYG